MTTAGSQSDFARAQKWARSYVSRLKSEGRLVLLPDGRVDFAASLERIKATSGATERSAPQVQGPDYAGAQDRERFYSAELKRIELDRQTREVLRADDVYATIDAASAIVRTTIDAWRDRMPPQIAAVGADEQRIGSLLAAECESLLLRLSQRLAALGVQPQQPTP